MGAPPISASEASEGTTIDATIDAAGETITGQQQLIHDSGLDLEWSSSEQFTLNEGLERWVSSHRGYEEPFCSVSLSLSANLREMFLCLISNTYF